MKISRNIQDLFTRFRKYVVTYSGGFFQLSNVANSPYTIVESFDKMPFCKHSREKKLLTSNTPFLTAQLYYAQLDDGLWVFVSDLKIKKNVAIKNLFDHDYPKDYNFINIHYNRKKMKSKSILIDGLVLSNRTWSIYKAGKVNTIYHFNGSHENNVTVYFTDEWLSRQQNTLGLLNTTHIAQFFQSENSYLMLPDTEMQDEKVDLYEEFLKIITLKETPSKIDMLKSQTNALINNFMSKYNLEQIPEGHFRIQDKDRQKILRAEKYLLGQLLVSFPGIENVAKEVGISPTKLKVDFKSVHNQSPYQYYRFHQMQLAHQLFTQNKCTVKEVAELLGYDNPSKFTAVFKDQFGQLPSEFLKS